MLNIETILSILGAIAMLLAGLWALFAFYDKKQGTRLYIDKEISLKLTEFHLKILQIERDLAEIRRQHDTDYSELKTDFLGSLNEFKASNSKINNQIVSQLKAMSDLLIRVDERLEGHINAHHQSQMKRKTT